MHWASQRWMPRLFLERERWLKLPDFFFKIQNNNDCVLSQILNFSFHDFLENEDLENTKVTSVVASASNPEPSSSPYRYGQQLLGS